MNDAIREIRVRAELLHHNAQTYNTGTLNRFRGVPRFDRANIRRRDCLFVIAREMGFPNWPYAKRVLSGEAMDDFGDLLCPRRCGGYLNLWYRTHGEAEIVRRSRGGYLLAYRKHFLVVERSYIEVLGLDPDDPDWRSLDFDWTHNAGKEMIRARFYSRLISALPREGV
jgi:hypothetical protein